MPRHRPQEKPNPYHLLVHLDAEDKRSLERIVKRVKLTKADTIRQLIRARARSLKTQAATQ